MYEYYHDEERQQQYQQPWMYQEQIQERQPEQQMQQFSPPMGQPPGQQFAPPFGQPPELFSPPFGQPPVSPGSSSRPPAGPPPAFVPMQSQIGVQLIEPGAIRPCTFRYVYIWLNTGERFWAWLVFVGRRSAAGWRWTGFRWIYFGVDLRNIESFICY